MASSKPLGVIDCVWSKEYGYTLSPAGKFNKELLEMQLESITKRTGKPVALRVSVAQPTHQRTGQQNKLMWALIGALAEHQTGQTPTPEERMALYCDLLAEFGSEVAYLTAPAGAEGILRRAYRALKPIEHRPDGRVEYMAVLGSSSFSRQEMRDFMEHIFDRLAEEGVHDPRLPAWRQDWLRLKK